MSIAYTPGNTFIFSFVRMNPPTPGHLTLIKTMIDTAIRLGSNKAYIVTSSSLDGKNPLPCSETTVPTPKNKADVVTLNEMRNNIIYKSSVLNDMIKSYKQQIISETSDPDIQEKITNLNVIVVCSVGSPFSFIYNLIKNDFIDRGVPKINIYFIVGRDRADFLDKIVNYFEDKSYVNSIDGLVLEREGMAALKNTGIGSRSISEINPSEYSASFIRNLVKNGQKDEFFEIYTKYISPEETEKLYDTIKMGTRLKSPPSKDEDENPQSEYFDGKKLPIMRPTAGGKKRATKKCKKTLRKRRKTLRKRRKTLRKY